MIVGGCLCGQVRFQIDGPIKALSHCHCSQCRKAYGSAFGTIAIVEAQHFSYLSGTDLIAPYRQSERVTRYFCRNCGSRLPIAESWDPLVGIPAGLLEGDLGPIPSAHIFVGSKAPWWHIKDSAPQYHEWKSGEDFNERFAQIKGHERKGQQVRIDRVAASSDPELPAFIARPPNAPVYHGFPLLEKSRRDGFVFGIITDVDEADPPEWGDAFVVAPNGSRAGIVWQVGEGEPSVICEPSEGRWGVYSFWFKEPIGTEAELVERFYSILPELKAYYGAAESSCPESVRAPSGQSEG